MKNLKMVQKISEGYTAAAGACKQFLSLGIALLFAAGLFMTTGCQVETFSIAGTVSGAIAEGVTVTLSGDGSATATTDSSGDYSFSELSNGSYTVTPSKAGYSFSLYNALVTVAGADVTGVDFTSSAAGSSTLGDRTDYDSVSLTPSGALSLTSSSTEQYLAITSTTSDKPGIKAAAGGDLTISNSTVTKSGNTNSSNADFSGINSGVRATSSSNDNQYADTGSPATISMTDCTITTNASGSNGAFAYGQDAVVTLDHVTINTSKDSSRGVDATYGGTVTITNSIINTQGAHCAALATDRYEWYEAPKINATNCMGTTAGQGSPGIYCTGTFTVADSTFTATGSEAAVIEGLNSITLTNTDISGAVKWGVMIYQSMSGDSSTGTGTFTMTGGTLTNSSTGPAFFVCNTTAVINLDGATINNSSGTLLKATTAAAADDPNVNSSWGTKGGTVTFTAKNQTLEGDIVMMESSSSIDLTLTGNSTLSGSINADDNAGAATLTLDATSSWEVTGDSYLTKLTNADAGNSNITGSGKVYVAGVQVY